MAKGQGLSISRLVRISLFRVGRKRKGDSFLAEARLLSNGENQVVPKVTITLF